MSTIANNVASKLFVAFVAVAMLFTLTTPAKAQSAAELQQMINDLLAQVSSLQGQLGGGGSMSASGVCPYTWTRSLNMGASGMDVMKLQQFLNSDVDTRVAAVGVGSAGLETEYYGGLTGAAVAKFQLKYRSDVLSPLGLVNSTTYFGPSTMAKANSLCASAMPGDSMGDSTGDDTTGDDDDDSSSNSTLNGGESSLESFQGNNGDDTNLEEGQNDAPVADFEFDVEDGDVKISRIDVAFAPDAANNSAADDDPWDVFDEVSIWVDGDKVADMDASDESDWSDDDPQTGQHKLRFTGLDWIVREGDSGEFTVGVTVQNSVDDATNGPEWHVFIPNEGIRGRDGAGIDQYTGESTDEADVEDYDESVTFTIEEEGGDDELKVSLASENPEETTFQVEDDSKSDWITILAFDLDSDDSVNDIEVNTIVVNVMLPDETTDTINEVVSDAQLVIDGEVYDDFTRGSGGAATSTFIFDIDRDLVIDAGDEVTAEFQIEFNGVTSGGYNEGQQIKATTTSDDIDAEGADDLALDQLSGQAIGKIHTLRSSGVVVSADPDDHDTDTIGQDALVGTFDVVFDVTAFENDIYITSHATTADALTQGGVYYSVETSAGTPTSITGTLSSTADEDTTDVFTVREGETEQFTLNVSVNASAIGDHRVRLQKVFFSENVNGIAGASTYVALPASDFRTAYQNILQ